MTTPANFAPRSLPPKADQRSIVDTVNQIVNAFPQFATAIQRFGAITSNTLDASAAFTAAKTNGAPIFLPYGTYLTSTLTKNGGTYPQRMYGDGVVTDSAANKAARYFSYISAAPSSLGTYTSILTAFNGDWTKSPFPVEHSITGASTLGTPASGYLYTYEAYPHFTYLYNSSGHNESTSAATGRTGACAYSTSVFQAGQGDAVCYNASGFVSSTRSGSTDVLANPAVALYNGGATAGADGVYLNLVEVQGNDAGFDCAAAGYVTNLTRTVTTGAKNAFWFGYRCQSIGSGAIDTMFSGTGKARFGLDLANATLTSGAAVTLSSGQYAYYNATAGNFFPSALGSVKAGYDGTNFIVAGAHLGLDTGKTLKVNNVQVVAGRDTGWTAMTNTADKATAYDTTTITLAQLAARVKSIQDAITTHGLFGA